MLHFPDIYRNIQAEIDAEIGTERCPSFDDWARLPYLRAVQLELQRWRSIVPISMFRNSASKTLTPAVVQPHVATVDDSFGPYLIPAGAVVWTNTVAMSRDPAIYLDPEDFVPERFLDATGNVVRRMEHPTFGYGKRYAHLCILQRPAYRRYTL